MAAFAVAAGAVAVAAAVDVAVVVVGGGDHCGIGGLGVHAGGGVVVLVVAAVAAAMAFVAIVACLCVGTRAQCAVVRLLGCSCFTGVDTTRRGAPCHELNNAKTALRNMMEGKAGNNLYRIALKGATMRVWLGRADGHFAATNATRAIVAVLLGVQTHGSLFWVMQFPH